MAIDKIELQRRLKGRTPDQQKVIKYFCGAGGCFNKFSDSDYDAMLSAKVKATDFKAKALAKIGLDAEEVNEIAPVTFEGYVFDNNKAYSICGKDGKWRSSMYQITWLFFSATQVYFYTYVFNMDEDGKKETTEEYFYKDITNFSTTSDTVEREVPVTKGCAFKKVTVWERRNIETNRFSLIVPGDKMYCAMTANETTERAIQGMKQKLREKKNA